MITKSQKRPRSQISSPSPRERSALQLYNKGLSLFKRREYQEAAETFSLCLEKEQKSKKPNSWNSEDIYNNMGICYEELMKTSCENNEEQYVNHYKTAKTNFKQSLKHNASRLGIQKPKKGRNWCSLYHLACCYMFVEGKNLGETKYEQSKQILEEILSNESEGVYIADELTLGSLGTVYFQNTLSYGVDFLSEAQKMLGDVYYELSEYGKAIHCYGKVIKDSKRIHREVEKNMAECLRKTQGDQNAWAYLSESRDSFSRGHALFRLERYEEAQQYLKGIGKGRHKDDHPRTVYYYRANKVLTLCYLLSGNSSKALTTYDKRSENIVDDEDLNETLYWNLAATFFSKEELEKADTYLDKSISSSVDEDETNYSIKDFMLAAKIKSSMNKNEKAIEFLNKALDLCSPGEHKEEQVSIYRSLITLFKTLKKLDEAVKACEELLEIDPTCTQTKHQLNELKDQINENMQQQSVDQEIENLSHHEFSFQDNQTDVLESTDQVDNAPILISDDEDSGEVDLLFYVCTRDGKLSQPRRYHHPIKPSTTVEQMRMAIIENIEVNDKTLNRDDLRISSRVKKPLFWMESSLVQEELQDLKVNNRLNAKEIYLLPMPKYQID